MSAGPGRRFEPVDDAIFGVDEVRAAHDVVVWLGEAALTGVVGNGVDRWWRQAVSRRCRWRLVRLPGLTAEGAIALAERALATDGLAGSYDVIESAATRDSRGRWVVTLHLDPPMAYTVRIPGRGHRADAVRVSIVRPAKR